MSETVERRLGSATYEATWVQRSNLIRLTACGIFRCANYTAQLEKRPERVLPPQWTLSFYVPTICLYAIKPFSIQVEMIGNRNKRDESVIVHDATGVNIIPVLSEEERQASVKSCEKNDHYIVYGKLPKPDEGHHGCIVVPADAIVIAIHYKAFGPDSKEACDSFVEKNCAPLKPLGGEVPWPLASEDSK